MTGYLITGGTGFIGRHVLPRLLEADATAEVHVLVRESSVSRLTRLASGWPGGDRVHALVGDLTAPGLGLGPSGAPMGIEHILHLGAIYDMTADADSQQAANVEGTSSVIDLALGLGAVLHHVSSIAVAGDYHGSYSEDQFDLGQHFPSPYHRTKFLAEQLVRGADGLHWQVYRPAVVVGDSRTGEMDKIDGPYYFFGLLRQLGRLPAALPVLLPEMGDTNVVPVDFVADAIVALMTRPQPDRSVWHLTSPRPQSMTELYNALAPAIGGPRGIGVLPREIAQAAMDLSGRAPLRTGRDLFAQQLGIPPVLLDALHLRTRFDADRTIDTLAGLSVALPDLADYAPALYGYWERELDPDRHRRPGPGGPLDGRHVVITGGSSGIGKESARLCASKGAKVIILARNELELKATESELRAEGGDVHAYACDLTDPDSVSVVVKTILTDHDHVDVLVNNAGRSIRRATLNATDRLHDYERTMAVNYFGAVHITLELLPQMAERKFGRVVNVSTIGVLAKGPRFGAYVASKAALDAFSDVTASETVSQHVTFTNIHMPLVRTRMIAATDTYDRMNVLTPQKAAAIVVKAIAEHPRRIDTPLGSLATVGHFLTPSLTAFIQHQMFLMFPDSAAAASTGATRSADGGNDAGSDTFDIALNVRDRVGRAARPVGRIAERSGVAGLARDAVRLIPGIHW
ncbi:SDR family oxidoreductase [Luteipulveratus mongoliensis]|uniref:Short-chain dehydrogenase n=1 Tax=Luteipulveratus mongoliensis TaxID=571913 RepID=A0A0K1JLA2_9MICO|nr:SDR family oxidoreductase [Luteipulveratus mongoliensis]AKU17350.1 short-chain dehydrogenase [Luteipulveratus mongoliensis]